MKLLNICVIAIICFSFLQVGNGMASVTGKTCAPMMAAQQLQPASTADHGCCCCGKQRGEEKQSCCELKARCGSDAQAASPLPASSAQSEFTAFAPTQSGTYLPPASSKRAVPKATFARETTYLVNLNFLC